jgi:hypothetical protein
VAALAVIISWACVWELPGDTGNSFTCNPCYHTNSNIGTNSYRYLDGSTDSHHHPNSHTSTDAHHDIHSRSFHHRTNPDTVTDAYGYGE